VGRERRGEGGVAVGGCDVMICDMIALEKALSELYFLFVLSE
jgi:hypothetical protein